MEKLKYFVAEHRFGKPFSIVFILISGVATAVIGTLMVLGWRKLTNTSFKSLGLCRPQSWTKTILIGLVVGAIIKLTFSTIILPLLGSEANSTTFDFLKGNLTNALLFAVYVVITAGFGEEIFFRGFLYLQLERWLGPAKSTPFLTVLIGSLIFGLPHIYQGGYGAIQSVLVGVIYGTMYLWNKRNLWLIMICHVTFNFIAIYIAYSDSGKFLNQLFF